MQDRKVTIPVTCQKCGEKFEAKIISPPPGNQCPKCGSREYTKKNDRYRWTDIS